MGGVVHLCFFNFTHVAKHLVEAEILTLGSVVLGDLTPRAHLSNVLSSLGLSLVEGEGRVVNIEGRREGLRHMFVNSVAYESLIGHLLLAQGLVLLFFLLLKQGTTLSPALYVVFVNDQDL